MKEVLLVGFGAVGAIYSLVLKRSGLARVTAVARSNYNIVKNEGMTYRSKKYGEITGWRPDRLCESVESAADTKYDYVMVTTKCVPELKPTSELLDPLLSKAYREKFTQPAYVLVQNGLNVEHDLHQALTQLDLDPPIISTALLIGTNLVANNIVEHNDFDKLTIGVYRPNDYTTETNTPEEALLLEDFKNILETGGSTMLVVPEIQRHKFSKNFWNVAFSSFATLTGYTLPSLWRQPPEPTGKQYAPYLFPATASLVEAHALPALRAVLIELLAVGRAVGFPDTENGLPSSIVDDTIEKTAKLHRLPESNHIPSMLLDAQNGQPIEVEVIVGEVVRMAQSKQVSIPRIEMLYALLLIKQNQTLREIASKKSNP